MDNLIIDPDNQLAKQIEQRIQDEVIHRLDIQTDSDWFRDLVKTLVKEGWTEK